MSRAECDIREEIGVDRIMWGADFPHIEGTWPYSAFALRDALNGCSAEEVRQMCSETAAKVYGFDLDALRPVAERVSPRLEDVLTPASPAAATYDPVDYALGKVSGKETGRRIMSTMLS
jgi:hypothetical protein